MGKRRTGIILAYSQDANAGVALSANGKKYLFLGRHWRSEGLPAVGDSVIFYALSRGRAVHVKREIVVPVLEDQPDQQDLIQPN